MQRCAKYRRKYDFVNFYSMSAARKIRNPENHFAKLAKVDLECGICVLVQACRSRFAIGEN
jgi:hypothetical protein